jgi:heme A synthase
MLISLALFLFAYRGYKNNYNWIDRAASITAGVAALGVAVFPTRAPEGVTPLSWWTPLTGILHFGFAIILLVMFAVFALFLFPIKDKEKKVQSDKRWRNRVYVFCGIVILASLIWAVVALRSGKSIFCPESIALVAFAVSWLVKGQAHTSIANKVRILFRRKAK